MAEVGRGQGRPTGRLLIFDEPAANLDPLGRRNAHALIEGLRGAATVFYFTHILDDAQRVSNIVAIFDRRRLGGSGAGR